MMSTQDKAEEYFRTMNLLAEKFHEDITEAKNSYESVWDTFSENEKAEIINESIIKPEIALKYALDNMDYDIKPSPIGKDLMSFFGKEHATRKTDNSTWTDEHSAPFIYQTKSQLNLCVLSEHRKKDTIPQTRTELEMTHSKVVSELKNALKSHDKVQEPQNSLLSKFLGGFNDEKNRDSLFGMFKTQGDVVKNSVAKSNSELSEENQGLLSNLSLASSTSEVNSTDTLSTSKSSKHPLTGFDFIDNW